MATGAENGYIDIWYLWLNVNRLLTKTTKGLKKVKTKNNRNFKLLKKKKKKKKRIIIKKKKKKKKKKKL